MISFKVMSRLHNSDLATLYQWKNSAEIIVLIEIREEAFWGGVSCAPANNNQNTKSPADLTNILLMVRKIKMRDERFLWITRSTPGVISPTEGELTSRRAMHRSARTAVHHTTTLHSTTPHSTVQLHFAPLYHTPQFNSALPHSTTLHHTLPHSTLQLRLAPLYTTPYRSTPLYSALHHRSIGGKSR